MRECIKPKNYKTDLYSILDGETIRFVDKNSGDEVYICFSIEDDEEGFYSEEYKVKCQGYEKKADITYVIRNKTSEEITWGIYEVKKSLIGEDVITKMFDQIDAGYHYLKISVLDFCPKSSGIVGVLTSNFDETILFKKISASEKKICTINSSETISIGLHKTKMDEIKIRHQIYCMKALLNRKYINPKTSDCFRIDIRPMKDERGIFCGYLKVQF